MNFHAGLCEITLEAQHTLRASPAWHTVWPVPFGLHSPGQVDTLGRARSAVALVGATSTDGEEERDTMRGEVEVLRPFLQPGALEGVGLGAMAASSKSPIRAVGDIQCGGASAQPPLHSTTHIGHCVWQSSAEAHTQALRGQQVSCVCWREWRELSL